MSTENKENASDADGGKEKIKYDWCEFFRFKPIAFCQSLLAQADSEPSGEQQVSNRKNALNGVRRFLVNNPFGSVAIGLILAGAVYLLYHVGFFKPNSITAIAAVVAAYWARMQWMIYSKQCEIMRDQHVTMEKQIGLAEKQLKETESASKQTDQIIAQMRSEQRPWLATSITAFDNLSNAYDDSVEVMTPSRFQYQSQ